MRRLVLFFLFVVGIVLFIPGILAANWMGQKYTESPDSKLPWWLTPFFSVTTKVAYRFFAEGLLIFGGILGGWAVAEMFRYRPKTALILFLGSVVSTAVGFNTFDWMVSYLTGSPGHSVTFSLWNFGLSQVLIDGYNFYIFAMLIPLWFGSFLVSSSLLYSLIQRRMNQARIIKSAV
jgi:hypothetical protein